MDKEIFFIYLIMSLIFISCNKQVSTGSSLATVNSGNNIEITSGPVIIKWPEEVDSLNREQIKKIRSLLNVYYTGNKSRWNESRSKLMQMGSGAKKALSLFFIKFFAAGKNNAGIDKHWKAARYELSLLEAFSVPYLISTMALPKKQLGTTGKIQCSETLAKIGKAALPALIENIGRGTPSFQRRLIETLGDIKSSKAIPAMISLYEKLREDAPLLQENVRDKEADTMYGIRVYIMAALSKIKHPKKSAKTVEFALSDPNRQVRKSAIKAAISIASTEYVYLLEKAKKVSRKDFPLSEYHTRINMLLSVYKQ